MVNFALFSPVVTVHHPGFSLKRRLPLSEMEVITPGLFLFLYFINIFVEKKMKQLAEQFENAKIQRPKVCIRCLNGEGGHITHRLEPMPIQKMDWSQSKM